VDGDGRTDLIFIFRHWDTGALTIRVKRSLGDGTFGASRDVTEPDGRGIHQYPALAGDVDGDGLTDLVFLYRGADGRLAIRTKRADGAGGWRTRTDFHSDGEGVHQHRTLLGDVDGDGRADLMFVFRHWDAGRLNLRIKRSHGDGTFGGSMSYELADGSGVDEFPSLLGDVTGDGHADVVFMFHHWDDGALRIRTKVFQGDSWRGLEAREPDGGGIHGFADAMLGDVDGDGRADLVFPFRHWDNDTFSLRVKYSRGGDGGFDTSTWSFLDQP
jgi:hypothetical protein